MGAGFTIVNVREVEDMAPRFGPSPNLESRWDAVRIPAPKMRALEGGPEGAELVAFGAPRTEEMDSEMTPGWWSE